MVPLSKLHPHLSVPLWHFSIFIFFIGSVWLTKKILISDTSRKTLSQGLYILAILLSLRFLLSIVQRVQSDALVLFLLSLFIFALFHQREVWAGLALASATMVKLTPLIFLPFLLINRRLKAAGAYLVFLLAYLLLPAVYLGWRQNLFYLQGWLFSLTKKTPAEYFFWYKNQSLFSLLMRFLSADSPVKMLALSPALVSTIFIILAAGLFGLIFIFPRKQTRRPEGFSYLVQVSLALVCMSLFSPLAWKHTFIHLIIPHLVLLYYLFYLNPQDKIVRGLLVGSFFINTVLNPEFTKPIARFIQEYSNVTFGTLLLYAALLKARKSLGDNTNHANLSHNSHL